jgi:hypothetical protein
VKESGKAIRFLNHPLWLAIHLPSLFIAAFTSDVAWFVISIINIYFIVKWNSKQ